MCKIGGVSSEFAATGRWKMEHCCGSMEEKITVWKKAWNFSMCKIGGVSSEFAAIGRWKMEHCCGWMEEKNSERWLPSREIPGTLRGQYTGTLPNKSIHCTDIRTITSARYKWCFSCEHLAIAAVQETAFVFSPKWAFLPAVKPTGLAEANCSSPHTLNILLTRMTQYGSYHSLWLIGLTMTPKPQV